jgi:predicted O-methyltransferase YrrM
MKPALSRIPLALATLMLGLMPSNSDRLQAAEGAKPAVDRETFLRNFKRIGLNTTPGDAMMLRILVQSSGAKRGVEVGTATGYGALHMGLGFERNRGELITVDIDADMVRQARANVAAMGLEKTVKVVEGDALKVLPQLEGQFDFVFLDALKRDYLKYFQALQPKLKPGALVVADNVIRSANEMRDFLQFMEKNPEWDMVIIRASEEKGDGMAICYWKKR